MQSQKAVCRRCFIPENFPGLRINSEGLCNVCEDFTSEDNMKRMQHSLALDNSGELRAIASEIKKDASKRGSKYDCIIGVSGGFDSTYVMYIARKIMGLNPLAVKYDNGFSHDIANQNLVEACRILQVDLKIVPAIRNERGYVSNSIKALMNLGLFFSVCYSCVYTIPSVIYKVAKEKGLTYLLASSNKAEPDRVAHSVKVKELKARLFRLSPWKLLKFVYYEILAQSHLARLKFQDDGFSMRFLRNLFKVWAPNKTTMLRPPYIRTIDVSRYVAWNWSNIEQTLRQELNWRTPRRMKIPYLRFDCHLSALVDKSYKEIVGITKHGLICNWFAQAGLISKEDLEDDFLYMENEERVEKDIKKVLDELDIPINKT